MPGHGKRMQISTARSSVRHAPGAREPVHGHTMPSVTIAQQRLDDLWDFSDPAASEERLRAAAKADSGPEAAELRTQVARALGLQERFDDADEVLDAIGDDDPAVRVRVALERGRVRNSAGQPDAAVPLFRDAADGAASAGLTFLQVDALHMLAIADRGHADEWADRALAVLGTTDDARTLRWRVGVLNNRGWTRMSEGRPEEALTAFQASREAAVSWGTPQQVEWADEAIAEARAAIDPAGR
jgi:tetratricopeptide (TPR) repeat protein